MKTIKILETTAFTENGGTVELLEDGNFLKIPTLPSNSIPNFPFPYLNPVQTVFYRHYAGGNALISSPTSSGKTLISLLFRLKNKEGRLIYTAPTRSLIYEKFKEFRKIFGRTGIRTGDLIEELDELNQQTVVSTYESLLSAARNRAKWFEEAEAVIIDEVHIIRDKARGAAVEEIVTYCLKEEKPLLCLSATIPGAHELAEWIKAELFIESEWRPVPLKREVFNFSKLLRKAKGGKLSDAEKIVSVIEHLKLKGKTLVFLPKKDLGWEALKVENVIYKKKILNETTPFKREEAKGEPVAFHNADVPQEERETIEREFKKGNLNRLYATQTLAYGVNLPADNVVVFVRGYFDRFTYKYSFFPDLLTIMQMEGRAGRWGFSKEGKSYLIVSGAKEEALLEALEEELESPFKTALSEGLELRERAACQNRTKSILSLMMLGPMVRYGRNWKDSIKETFSVKKNPLLFSHLQQVEEELIDLGFRENGKPTPLCLTLAASYISPYCYLEFKNRLKHAESATEEEKTILYAFAVRPLIKRDFSPGTLLTFTGEGFKSASAQITHYLHKRVGEVVKDNSDVLIFYALGDLYPFSNVARPPGELSNLSSESSLLASFLCRINALDFDTVHRIAMMIRQGIPFSYSLLAAVEGLGYMRGNALVRAAKLTGLSNEIALINSLKEKQKETLEALKETLSIRLSSKDAVNREFNRIVKIVEKVKFPLGNLKLLRFLASTFIGREKALKLSKEEALEVLFENVTGQKKDKS